MAKIGILKATQVDTLPPGLHADGGNLFLDVRPGGRSWAFISKRMASRYFSFGPAGKHGMSLADARDRAIEGRALLAKGIDPRTVWEPATKPKTPTFSEANEGRFAHYAPGWKNRRYEKQWRQCIADNCQSLMNVPCDEITQPMVHAVLEPIWNRIPATASTLRGWIERIIDFGRDTNDERPNPARWERGRDRKLRDPEELILRRHYPALDYREVPAFGVALRGHAGVSARALEFLMLTASRTGEARLATWDEIDFETKTWTLAQERLKQGRHSRKAHVVPLSGRAITILEGMALLKTSNFVFQGRDSNKPISESSMTAVLKIGLGRNDVSVHGMRSCFRTWVGEETSYAREIAEMALGHSVGNKTELSYFRGNSLERRRELMEAWCRYCLSPPGKMPGVAAANVVSLPKARTG
jgi:integrase